MSEPESNSNTNEREDDHDDDVIKNPYSVAGLLFIFLSFVLMIVAAFKITFYTVSQSFNNLDEPILVLMQIFTNSFPHLLLIFLSLISAYIGRGLLHADRISNYSSIPEGDLRVLNDAIKDGKSEPIDQYIRLRALSGFTGGFTKIGLTGLPLVTIGVTIIFTILSLWFYQQEKVYTNLFDLAKLTLGAFIGSFVQRQVERTRQDRDHGSKAEGDLDL